MPKLILENKDDRLDLDEVMARGTGVQALSGLTGLGLPPVGVQWLEGAGDGSLYRGRRVLARDIDLPLYVQSGNYNELKTLVSRVAMMLGEPCTLRFVEDTGNDWSLTVVRTGGGGYTYGEDTNGKDYLSYVMTLRAGDPFFTSGRAMRKTIGVEGANRTLLPKLGSLKLTASQAFGVIQFDNSQSDADVSPIWEIYGPGSNIKMISSAGEVLHYTGTVAAGKKLTIYTGTGQALDSDNVIRYNQLAPAPKFWKIPPGISSATVSMDGTVSGTSKVICWWRPRKWMVI